MAKKAELTDNGKNLLKGPHKYAAAYGMLKGAIEGNQGYMRDDDFKHYIVSLLKIMDRELEQ